MFRRRPGRLLNVLSTFNLHSVYTGKFQAMKITYSSEKSFVYNASYNYSLTGGEAVFLLYQHVNLVSGNNVKKCTLFH